MQQPPRSFWQKMAFLGPGIVFAAMAIGSGELILTPRAAAEFGYTLAWVTVVTLIFKGALTDGIARYTAATGKDIFHAFGLLPGPAHWGKYFIMFIFSLEMIGYGGIALAAGTAVKGLFPDVDMKWAAIVLLGLIPCVLYSGSYKVVEKVVMAMCTVLVFGALYSVWQIPFPMNELLEGFVPSVPPESTKTIMSLMGWVGAGTTTLLYSSWVKEKIGKVEDEATYRSWISTIRIDLVVSYLIIFVISLSFLILGAYKLHPERIIPERSELMMVLSRLLNEVPGGTTVFLITALCTLASTVIAGVDGKCRAFASMWISIFPRMGTTLGLYRSTMVFYLLLMAGTVVFGQPVKVINTIAAVTSIIFGVLGFMFLYVDSKLPHYARGSLFWKLTVVLGSLLFLSTTFLQWIL